MATSRITHTAKLWASLKQTKHSYGRTGLPSKKPCAENMIHLSKLKWKFKHHKTFVSMCNSVSLEITNIRQTMVKYPAVAYKCRTMRHYFRDEPLICSSLRHAAAARTESRANNRARKNHHLMRLWPRRRPCKPPCSKWDMLQKRLKDNYKSLTCKKNKHY